MEESGERYRVVVSSTSEGDVEYMTPPKNKTILAVKTGDMVNVGDCITSGSIYPNDILRVRGLKGAEEYLLKEVLGVYRLQDVQINAKHIEIIIRQMLRKVKIEDPGDSELLPGNMLDIQEYEQINNDLLINGKRPATAKRVLLGITKASLHTESFLSAASFQQTSAVLTEASIKGKVDHLEGLKENIMIGKLIPAGTGLKAYKDIYPTISKDWLAKQEAEKEKELANAEKAKAND